ncbi:helix-turn-helix domain-containing protein [Priestia filamentosa]|uniref:helix-turn-helix domain-containing protein n=1 Tax=Priestia filamentosa TaxID=1402861 RepID=UPI002E1DEB6A|nr:helix-turn-helix domain-containing protein [Priestia filamentosa]
MKEYKVKEVAQLVGKHEETVKRWIRTGKFPNAYRNSDKEGWRIPEGDLLQLGTLITAQEYKKIQGEKQLDVQDSILVKLAYEAITLTSPTEEMLNILSVVGIHRTLEILLIMQQSATKVKNPDGFIKKAIRENWSPSTLPVKLLKKQSKHLYDFTQKEGEPLPNQKEPSHSCRIPFVNWLED